MVLAVLQGSERGAWVHIGGPAVGGTGETTCTAGYYMKEVNRHSARNVSLKKNLEKIENP